MKLTQSINASFPLMVMLILLTNVIPPMSVDEYTPSLPHMITALSISVPLMQLTVTFYMLAFAISQVVCGTLSDTYGRKIVLLLNMPIFFIGCLFCMFANSATMLILGRILQGLGVGASALTGPALMADCFDNNELTKVSGYYSTVYSFIPISAPIIGGFIQEYIGWRANFTFLLIVAIIIYVIFYFKLPETHQPSPDNKISVKNIIKSYSAIFSHKQYMVAVFCLTLTWSMFVVFSIMAPFIMQNVLGYSPSEYGLQALSVGLGFFVGNSVNNFLIKKMDVKAVLQLGLIVMILMSLLLLILPMLNVLNAWAIMVPVFVMMIGAGMSFPHLYAYAVSAVPEYAGLAGALIGSLILVGAVIITALITRLHAHSAVAMASVYLVLTVLCFLAFKFVLAKIKN